MTDGLDQALAAVALTLLGADPALTVYDGEVPSNPTPPPPYAVVYTSVGHPSVDPDNAIDGRSRVYTARWYVHCVGGSAQGSRAVAQRVRTALMDVRPAVPTLSCGLIREQPGGPPPQRDELSGYLIMNTLLIYDLRATN